MLVFPLSAKIESTSSPDILPRFQTSGYADDFLVFLKNVEFWSIGIVLIV